MGTHHSKLNEEQKATLDKDLNNQYEYCKALRMEDDIILSTLQTQYSKLFETYCSEKIDPCHEDHTKFITKEISKRNIDTASSIIPSKQRNNSIKNSDSTYNTLANAHTKSSATKSKVNRRKSFDIEKQGPVSNIHLPNISNIQTNESNKTTAPTNSLDDFLKRSKSNKVISNNASKKGSEMRKSVSMEHFLPPIDSSSNNNKSVATTTTSTSNTTTYETNTTRDETIKPSPIDNITNITTDPAAVADCWDSVTQQPFCTICQMAFKSIAFLERHNKYSDLHKSNVLKEENKLTISIPSNNEVNNTTAECAIVRSPLKRSENKNIIAEQIEGAHYKLLYNGSKLFWRTQRTVDFDIYHHILPHAIEVIAFDSEKHKEINRIYLDYGILSENVADRVKESVEFKKHKILSTDKFAKLQSDEILYDEMRRTKITNFVLSHLQECLSISTTNEDISKTIKLVEFCQLETDIKSPLLLQPPATLIPLHIARRRRSSAEEIESTLQNLKKDRIALVHATNRAEKIADHVYHGAAVFLSHKDLWYRKLNPVRRRWVWAIRKVILKKRKADMIQHLSIIYLGNESPKSKKFANKKSKISKDV